MKFRPKYIVSLTVRADIGMADLRKAVETSLGPFMRNALKLDLEAVKVREAPPVAVAHGKEN